MHSSRRLPIGAEPQSEGGAHFRVWAPKRRRVEVVLDSHSSTPLQPENNGYHSGFVAKAGVGALYQFRLDGEEKLYPDPASRFQPEGPHGPSQVIDPIAFRWTDRDWPGRELKGQVIYELHIGTFTKEGTWQAAAVQLPKLAELGVTVIEVMPIADFPGRFGWGYDGVNLFAPTWLYGNPDDFRRFVDHAHRLGVAVILDVVYNHFGPDGNYLRQYSEDYFTARHSNDWGEGIQFDGPAAGPVRDFFIANAGYWIDEFHLDGLRLDATQDIHDDSKDHILAAIARRVREAARGRKTIIVAENEPEEPRLVRPAERGGYGLDGLWNDDFHHNAMVAMTAHSEAYYTDYRGSPEEFVACAKWGFLYQGQYYSWQEAPRGGPALDLSPWQFITFIENHDQTANSGGGLRCHRLTSPGRYRAMTALMLLSPGTPMLFQGQEFASSRPFVFIADHHPELAAMVRKGRLEFLTQFPSLATAEMQARIPDPGALETFERCKLDFAERELHAEAYALHKDLLQLRRSDPVFQVQRPHGVDGAPLSPSAWMLRYFAEEGDDRLLLVNLGRDLHLGAGSKPVPEPLLAPPLNKVWTLRWSSEDPRYGGFGTPAVVTADGWHIPGESAVVLVPGNIPEVT